MEKPNIYGFYYTFEKKIDELRGRLKITKDQRLELAKRLNMSVIVVNTALKKKHLKLTIKPLSGRGTNEKKNLQVLCKACHLIQTSNEHESGQ